MRFLSKTFRAMPVLIMAALGAWLSGNSGAAAGASAWVETQQSAVRLVSSSEAVGSGEALTLGFHFRLKPGWKIYWRSPGDAGFPPRPDWQGSENLAAAEIRWPVPERFSILGFETFGYEDEVVLPVAARLAEPGRPLASRARIEYLTCKDICIPYEAELALDLPSGAALPGPSAHLIARFEARVPGDGSAHGLRLMAAEAGNSAIHITASASQPFGHPDVYLESDDGLGFGEPEVRLEEGGRRARLTVPVTGSERLKGGLAGRMIVATLVDGGRAAERRMTLVPPTAAEAPPQSLLSVLLLALLGGVILNLMPCVLPVISLKLIGAVGHGGGERHLVRLSFVASATGILASFLLMGGVLATLKTAGAAVGWGLQFQHPVFLAAMTLVVTLFACNLWGFFEVRLPEWVSDLGEHASHVHGLGGHFLSGALATLLATPCSAPFLGTAVGFALARGTGEIMAVFAMLGIGLGAPYFAVALAPGLATRLPKPGAWMVGLRRILGFALAGTGAWLLSVLFSQADAMTGTAVAGTTIGMGLVLFLRHRASPRGRNLATLAVLGLAGLAVMLPALPTLEAGRAGGGGKANGIWQPFDETAIPELVAAGRVVFVDVTADWCITCQVNKSLVLNRGTVAERLRDGHVNPMQADWTRPDETIQRYLAKFGRYGIPFDAVYGPGAPDGIALPELLTEETVLEALDRATRRLETDGSRR